MLGKRQRSVIGKLSDLLVSGSRSGGFFDPVSTTSPRGPLDPRELPSPRGHKSYDLGGVGIVAALETSETSVRCLCRSRITASSNQSLECFDDSENYTYVTCYGPNCQSFTKVYYSGEYFGGELTEAMLRQVAAAKPRPFPTMEFLSSCSSCKKKLHGEDAYIYRGEKAFCSSECRLRQIAVDDRIEECRSDGSSSSLSTLPYTEGDIFSTEIIAT